MALLHIVDASGRQWQCQLSTQSLCTIGRAPDNTVVLNDPRASRYHAHVRFQNGKFVIIDGRVDGGRSANHVFVGGEQLYEHELKDGDRVTIGASQLRFEHAEEARPDTDVRSPRALRGRRRRRPPRWRSRINWPNSNRCAGRPKSSPSSTR